MSTKKAGVDEQLIRDLAGILNDTNLTEIEVELGDLKVRVSRHAPAVHAVASPAPVFSAPNPGLANAPAQPAAPAAVDPSKNAVPSPMVGTAYLAPSPDAKPFVEIGQAVKEGQDPPYHRGDEDDEPDPLATLRYGDCNPHRGRSAGRVRHAARRHRSSPGSRSSCFTKFSSPIAAKSPCGFYARRRSSVSIPLLSIPPPTPTRCMCASPMKAYA